MKRHSATLDSSIRNDRREQDRIRLEHNLQHTDLSLHLSSNDNSVEYPRHAPGPFHNDFIDFERHVDSPWSYDDGASPYGGETISTAAHHASALTLSAGLAGRGHTRRDVSLSGAEFDPERPLKDMLAAVDPKLSMFDMDPSRSRYSVRGVVHQPRVVLTNPLFRPSLTVPGDSTGSYNPDTRVLSESAPHIPLPPLHPAPTRTARVRVSPKPSNASLSLQNDPAALRHYHYTNQTTAMHRFPPSPLSRPIDDNATPRPQRRTSAGAASQQQQLNKTPRVVARDFADENAPQKERNPFSDVGNRDAGKSINKSRVYLPDVTGLTNAVESPAKPGGYNAYNPDFDRPRDSEARLLSTLATVQARLHDLEDENAISRRRVRELELELEVCKREVVKERTRILERGEMSARLDAEAAQGKGKGKAREVDTDVDVELAERYKQAVEDKKSLEALISSLRSHLSRLTAELSSHQDLLMELRKLRERDSRALKEKSAEVDRLRQEVERLAGEVEVLRGVVEDGLRERRSFREDDSRSSEILAPADVAMSADMEETFSRNNHIPEQEEDEEEEEEEELADQQSSVVEEEESEAEPFDPMSIMGSSRENMLGGMTARTDHATRGSSRFIGNDELERIMADVQERRSELSSNASRERDRALSPSPQRPIRRATVEDVSDDGRPPTPVARAGPSNPRAAPHPTRPTVPTPSRARYPPADADNSDAFPQIRGARLERLFFSAPEHNPQTCTVCYREQRTSGSWLAERERRDRDRRHAIAAVESDEDEGFAEDDEDVEWMQEKRNGKQREPTGGYFGARNAGLPAQTVVARVIRGLEDDFVHYKSTREMDAVSDVPKRNLVAKHLREVIDILEPLGDRIADLYSCLTYKDKPIPASKRTAGAQEYAV
ncbi:AAA family ATPase [Mycena chlorophos]|uniref:AAA family ATPase n=1 Tax=Mycena chlorophos TaxID=658473 RepID=A0A8H6S3Z0_MYCCL|nr:AAA family ATPase [Mycena chlorophos]